MKRLEQKVAIVTGGNSGIGYATAALFCKEGAKVVIASRREEENNRTVAELSALGGEILAVQADLTIIEDCKRVIAKTMESFGRIDILVNNAGIADKHMPITHCSEAWFDEVCKIDLYAVFYMTKYALEHMQRAGSGSIINISSIGSQGVAGISYGAAKAAVNAMTKNVAIQFADSAIRCNAVAPGPTPTPLNTPDKIATFHTEMAQTTAKHLDLSVPVATVEDQAEAILFFASDVSKAITGQILYVDHGTSMY